MKNIRIDEVSFFVYAGSADASPKKHSDFFFLGTCRGHLTTTHNGNLQGTLDYNRKRASSVEGQLMDLDSGGGVRSFYQLMLC